MTLSRGFFGVCAVVLCAACEGNVVTGGTGATGGQGGAGGQGAIGGGGAGGEGGGTSTNTGGMVNTTINTSTGTGAGPCDPGDPGVDDDGDAFSELEGDCNDCDPVMNPGALEVVAQEPKEDGTIPEPADEDCDGMIDEPSPTCDEGLALASADPLDGAKAIDLCQTTSPADPRWGVLSAAYVGADGFGSPDPLQWGLKPGFGPNVNPQGGGSLLVLSNGHARAVGDPDACGAASCVVTGEGEAPPGFPQYVPSCEADSAILDDVALQLEIRVPTNAKGHSFDFKFHSFEYPEWVCSSYNDQLVAIVSPAPPGSLNGNVAFDAAGAPIGVNAAFVGVCDPLSAPAWAQNCFGASCPPLPDPYCPLGTAELLGTGFLEWSTGHAGATPWLRTTAPVEPGSVITVRLVLWDSGDASLDSTGLFDHWQWITGGGAVNVGTAPIPDPK